MSKSGRILIVDDNEDVLSVLAELMVRAGYDVETATNGFEALLKLGEFAPDLVLTDLNMPGLGGLELTRKALEQDPERPVVVMTGSTARETEVAVMRAGAAGYLFKPISQDKLLLVVERVLESSACAS